MSVHIVDTPNKVVSLLDHIENQPTKPPSFYLDIEGVSLSRYGSISIIQLLNLPQNNVFLIDIFVLGQAAFDTRNSSGTCLRSILESETIPKAFFDLRNDSDALFAHFNISLRGSHDVQLLKAATQPWAKRVAGLRQCIRRDAQLSADVLEDWQTVKAKGIELFATEHGGSYEVFNIRPLLQDIIIYCAQDVMYLPILWKTYTDRLSPSWLNRVEAETEKRVMLSQAEVYEPNGEDKVWSPWAKDAKHKYLEGASRKSDVRQKAGRGLSTVENQRGNERKSVLQLVNAKLERQQAEKVPSAPSSLPASVSKNERKASNRLTMTVSGQPSEGVSTTKNKLTTSNVVLPANNRQKIKAAPVGELSNKGKTPVVSVMWTCTACSREMQNSQKEAHLAGKPHIAREKQILSAASGGLSLPGRGEIDTSKTAKKSTAEKERVKPKAKAKNSSKQAILGDTGPNGTRRMATTTVPTRYLPYEPFGNADWGFVGFSQGSSRGSTERDDYWLGGGDNYGACDKDCGWCGCCMDNIDIDI